MLLVHEIEFGDVGFAPTGQERFPCSRGQECSQQTRREVVGRKNFVDPYI